ncbi:MAG: carbohydrate ABC transporter permease [Vallitalea sp.]|jgi:raffinose/stachyose/melibiose transport system permease protein|nr:carbohydrate ABC transporter permease [Vallitalea sp.]
MAKKILKTVKPLDFVLIVTAFIWLIPLYCAVINSFKMNNDIIKNPFSISIADITMENYLTIIKSSSVNLFELYKNSFLITGVSVGLLIIICPLAAYYIARTTSVRSQRVLTFFLLGMMISQEVILIPLAGMYRDLDLIGKRVGLYLFYLGNNSSFSILLYSKFIKSTPVELEESAHMDGASRLRTFWSVIFPLLKPCTATVIVFVGLNIWNDFLTPMVLLGNTKGTTITLGIYRAIGPYQTDYGAVFTFVILASLPILIIFLSMQKRFISGLTAGAIKG